MKVCVVVNAARVLRWHGWLVEDLAAAVGQPVAVLSTATGRTWPASVTLTIRLDRLVNRTRGTFALDKADASGFPRSPPGDDEGPFDIVIDCSGGASALPTATRILETRFNGIADEMGMMSALIDGDDLVVDLFDPVSRTCRATARPAVPNRRFLTEAFDAILSRTIELIVNEVKHPSASRLAAGPFQGPASVSPAAPVGHFLDVLSGKLSRRLKRQLETPPRWACAWRRIAPGAELVSADWPAAAAFNILKDDGQRFFADPFPVLHQGRRHVFCEEYPFSTERGIISVFTVAEDGTPSTPVPVLEEAQHLSYPFVFEQDGAFWMIPETAEAGLVALYQCTAFPDRWERVAVLVEGVAGCDATIIEKSGLYWMFLTTACRKSTTWDNLRLFHAPALTGPWQECETGLIFIDAARSRPGGAVRATPRGLVRPAQDSTRYYGNGLHFARIDELGETRYAETIIGSLQAGSDGAALGIHTYGYCGDIEVVDIFGSVDGLETVEITSTGEAD